MVLLTIIRILDLDAPHIRLKDGINSDLITPRSMELGIGVTCLIANKCFNVPWDQLGALPGPGKRFDYRAQRTGFDGIFESKGTSHLTNQSTQIRDGIAKKEAHHARRDRFDAEVIISTFIGKGEQTPRIIIGDPDFDDLARLYDQTDSRFFRLRHYTRVLQFLGLPKSAYELNRYALEYLKEGRNIRRTVLDEKEQIGYLQTETFENESYYGRWFDKAFPDSMKTDKRNLPEVTHMLLSQYQRIKVFQGIRADVYHQYFGEEPFNHRLLGEDEIIASLRRINRPASLFPDGTIQIFAIEY